MGPNLKTALNFLFHACISYDHAVYIYAYKQGVEASRQKIIFPLSSAAGRIYKGNISRYICIMEEHLCGGNLLHQIKCKIMSAVSGVRSHCNNQLACTHRVHPGCPSQTDKLEKAERARERESERESERERKRERER